MKQRDLTKKQQKNLGLAAVFLALALTALVAWRVGVPLLRFAREPETFRAWVDSHGFLGELAYMGMVLFQVVVALLPGEPFEIAGGYAFGALEGTVLCLIASGLGSMLVFWLVRRFGLKLVEVFFPVEKLRQVRFLKNSPRRDLMFLLVFMVPGTPKDLLCWFAGLTDIKTGAWLLICTLGRLPSILTSTLGGDALGERSYGMAAVVFAATLAISAGGLVLYRKLGEREE